MTSKNNRITIEEFNGAQAVADEIANIHLGIRFEQRKDGTNDFQPGVTDIYDSQPDLHGMQDFYVKPGGNFWIACDGQSGRVIGFVGLKKESEGVGILKRMAVVKEYRHQGIGRKLTETLIAWAKEHGFKEIKLGTGIDEEAHGLYLKQGFIDTGFGKNGADYRMRLELN